MLSEIASLFKSQLLHSCKTEVNRHELDSHRIGNRRSGRHYLWLYNVISVSKKNSEDRKNERYKLLRENVFDRLSNLRLNTLYHDGQPPKTILELSFNDDILDIMKSKYYEEAKMHLSDDMPDYLNGLAKLQCDVEKYNTYVEEFVEQTLRKLVECYLKQNLKELAISNRIGEVEPMNSISLYRLLSRLKEYWLLGREFDVHYKDGNFNYQWENIATISDSLEIKLRRMTSDLQNQYDITSEIEALKTRRDKLIKRAEELGTDIHNKMIFHIERKTYKTKCRECPK
jgi:hypothetical protein